MSSTGPDSPAHPADSDVVDLPDTGRALLEEARTARNGHASRLLVGGAHQRAVLTALTSGSRLGEHDSPAAASFQVVTGRARLYEVDGQDWSVAAGQLVAIPATRHGVEALEDCVILLTVALD